MFIDVIPFWVSLRILIISVYIFFNRIIDSVSLLVSQPLLYMVCTHTCERQRDRGRQGERSEVSMIQCKHFPNKDRRVLSCVAVPTLMEEFFMVRKKKERKNCLVLIPGTGSSWNHFILFLSQASAEERLANFRLKINSMSIRVISDRSLKQRVYQANTFAPGGVVGYPICLS